MKSSTSNMRNISIIS